MKTIYAVSELSEWRYIQIGGQKELIEMKWAEGMIGIIPVFSLSGFAKKYNAKADIIKFEKQPKENKMNNTIIIEEKFQQEIAGVINKFGLDAEFSMPDNVLAGFLCDSIKSLSIMREESPDSFCEPLSETELAVIKQ